MNASTSTVVSTEAGVVINETGVDAPGGVPALDQVHQTARLIRAAYANSDPLPGLDRPDGADESAESVLAQLESGVRLWTASDATGAPAGCLMVTRHPGNGWEVHRVAVSSAWQGRGVARALLAAVSTAAQRQSAELWLNAVVERCLPPLYAGLGYRPTHVFPGPGKPLTEWRMRWEPTAGQPSWYSGIRVPAGHQLCWFVAADRLVAVIDNGDGRLGDVVARASGQVARVFPALREQRIGLAGVDALPPGPVVRHLAAAESTGDVHLLRVPRAEHPFHLRPRKFEPEALALCRFAPGREPLIDLASPTKEK